MNSFLASGGDGFTVFNQCTNALGGEIDLDALVRYFMEFGDGNPPPEPVPPGPQNRITRIRLAHTSTVSPSRGIITSGTAAASSARVRGGSG